LIRLVLAYLRDRPLTAALNIALLAISVAMLVLLLQFARQAEDSFLDNAGGVDLVVGAKGSPLQLVLSAVYHLDEPTGNIPSEALASLRGNPAVRSAIPLALGDNFEGYRIVGTEPEFLSLYAASLASGRIFSRSSEVVLGADVARSTGAAIGQKFLGSHGLGDDGAAHEHAPFVVVGILAATGTVSDRLILTPLESVWDVHGIEHHDEIGHADESHGAHEHEGHEGTEGARPMPEITAVLVTYRNPAAAVRLLPMINRQTNMQAASPAREGVRLIGLFDAAIDAIAVFGWLLAATGGLAIFAALYNAVRAREGDLALLRVMGASRTYVFSIVLVEGIAVAVIGAMCGIALAHLLLWGAATFYPTVAEAGISPFRLYPDEFIILAGVAAIGLVAALLPAITVYRGSLMPILTRN
jgi:putative ABC transport system permease protein